LDDPTGDGDTTLASVIEDEDAEDAEMAVLVQDIREQSIKILDELSERDRLIFTLRYGEEPASLEEIGDQVGLTRERVRQILEKNRGVLRAKAQRLGFG
jgi:RNA polymerase nonessential primary-like sigma factor